ncbi:MAG TPA: septal ring lytic transglycosylase RlpA family protein [Oleiagrimonas sp.]|nr:septal ring lytic transglycosylase RlpA family protein [Oleiagrimonas sp.]
MNRALGIVVALAVGVVLSGCASNEVRHSHHGGSGSTSSSTALPNNTHLDQSERYRLEHDRGPGRPAVDISTLREPVPRALPRSRYGNKSPYTVNGETYHVLSSAEGYDETGLASWYGKKFDGYLTSSMERYDMYKFTAASKVLPLPTFARVTNLANGKSVIVKVNDRGPFVDGRIIDLSYAAAVRIGVWPQGTARVEVQAIDPAHPAELSAPTAVGHTNTASQTGQGVWLQVGSFANQQNARQLATRLRRAGVGPVHVSHVTVRGRGFSRVRVGPLQGVADVQRVRAAIEAMGLPTPKVALN